MPVTDIHNENNEELILIIDGTLSVVSANISFRKLLGFTEEELLSADPEKLVEFSPGIRSLRKSAELPGSMRCSLISKSEKKINCTLRIHKITGKDQNYILIFNPSSEFSDARKNPEYNTNLLSGSFNQTPIPMVLVTYPDLKFKIINQALIDFLEIEDEPDYTGWKMTDLNPSWKHYLPSGEEVDFANVPIARALRGEKTSGEMMNIVTKNGNSKWCLVNGAPIYDEKNNLIAGYVIFPEITSHIKTQNALAESEKMYKLLAENMHDVVWMMEPYSLRLIYISPSVQKLRGYTAEEVMNQTMEELLTNESRQILQQVLERNIRAFYEQGNEKIQNYINIDQPCKDGNIVNTEVVITYIPDEKGELDFILGVSRNITDRIRIEQRVKESEKFLSQIIKHAPLSVILSKLPEETIISVNDKFIELFGYERDDMPDLSAWWALAYPDPAYREKVRTIWSKSIQKAISDCSEISGIETWVTAKSGKRLYCDFKGITIDGTLILFVTDLTERKNTENEIRELSTQKDKFFSVIAHDLRGPFHYILGYSEVLLEEDETLEPGERRKIVQKMNKTAAGAYKLLVNLLDWGRLQMNKIAFRPEKLNISEILQEIISENNNQAAAKSIKINTKVSDSLLIKADKYMFQMIIRNLLSNAVKFSEAGSEIFISAIEEADFVKISVKDFGVGISHDDIGRLFNLDESLSSEGTAGEKGTGLGLILVKEFTEKNGGTIEVKSKPGLGSTFTVNLPGAIKQIS